MLNFNIDDLPDEEIYTPPPAGEYDAIFTSASFEVADSGWQRIKYVLQINGGEHAGKTINDSLSTGKSGEVTDKQNIAIKIGLTNLKKILKENGIGGQFTDAGRLVGLRAKVITKLEQDQKDITKYWAKIVKFLNLNGGMPQATQQAIMGYSQPVPQAQPVYAQPAMQPMAPPPTRQPQQPVFAQQQQAQYAQPVYAQQPVQQAVYAQPVTQHQPVYELQPV